MGWDREGESHTKILCQARTLEEVIAEQMQQGFTPTVDTPRPGGLDEEEIVEGDDGGTVHLCHMPDPTTTMGETVEERKGGGGKIKIDADND